MNRPELQDTNPQRIPVRLDAQLNKSLVSYVAAAGAAGAGMLASALPADAEVVYTPANIPLVINTPVALDLNHDGMIDFELSNHYDGGLGKSCTVCSFFEHASLKVSPSQAGNAIWGMTSVSHHSSVLPRKPKGKNRVEQVAVPVFWGVVVGHERNLEATPLVMDSANFMYSFSQHFSYNSIGAWGKGRRLAGPYLGLKFTVGGEVHYGWARIEVKANRLSITATLTGYAYETVPNRGIITGITHGTLDQSAEVNATPGAASATLGRLAQGATGLSAWRGAQAAAENTAPVSSN